MFSSRNKILGLDIGSNNLKWIIYSKNKGMPVIHDWGIEKTPTDSVRNGRILDKNKLLDKFKEIFEKTRIKATFASFTLACPEMIIRTVDVPKLKQRELQNVIGYEAEQFIPGSSKDYIIDYKIFGKETNDSQKRLLKALVVAVPYSVVENYIELLENLNIKPLAVDFHSNSACRFVNRFLNNMGEKNYVLVDLGASNTIITIAEHGVPVLTRIIQIGSEEIARALANSFNLTLEDGEKYINTHRKVFLDDEKTEDKMPWEMMTTILPTVELLLKDIFQSVEFYKSMTQKSIDTILVIGGGSGLKNIGRYIAQQLNIDNLSIKGVFPMKMQNDMPEKMINLFCNVLGLAFREER